MGTAIPSVVMPRSPLPSVEVDTEGRSGVSTVLASALVGPLVAFARAKPKALATLYLYESPSFNFGQPTQSAFVAVSGPTALLQRVHSTLGSLFAVRFGDYISYEPCVPLLHLEAGVLYEPTPTGQWRVAGCE